MVGDSEHCTLVQKEEVALYNTLGRQPSGLVDLSALQCPCFHMFSAGQRAVKVDPKVSQ